MRSARSSAPTPASDIETCAREVIGADFAFFVVLAGGGLSGAAASEGQAFARSVADAAKAFRTLLEQAEPSPPPR